MSGDIWQGFPRWFRTLPKHGDPTEQIVRLTLQNRAVPILAKCRPGSGQCEVLWAYAIRNMKAKVNRGSTKNTPAGFATGML